MARKNTKPESENRKQGSGAEMLAQKSKPKVFAWGWGDTSLLEKEKRHACFTFCRCRVMKKLQGSIKMKLFVCVCVWKSPPKVKGVEKEGQRYRTLTFIHYLEERLGCDQVSGFQLCSERSYFLRLRFRSQLSNDWPLEDSAGAGGCL